MSECVSFVLDFTMSLSDYSIANILAQTAISFAYTIAKIPLVSLAIFGVIESASFYNLQSLIILSRVSSSPATFIVSHCQYLQDKFMVLNPAVNTFHGYFLHLVRLIKSHSKTICISTLESLLILIP